MRRVAIGLAGIGVGLASVACSAPEPERPAQLTVAPTITPSPSTPSVTVEMTPVEPSPTPSEPTTAVSTPTVATYAFPVSPASVASYGRAHHDYPASDVFAPCGSDAVAVTSGAVEDVSRVDEWDASDDPAVRGGLSVSVVGDDGVRYYASHLLDILPAIQPGTRVQTGELIGHVGKTGNAVNTDCHLHFGLSPACGPGDSEVRRGTIVPWPYLDAWKAGDPSSPTAEVAAWLSANEDRCPALAGG